MSVTTFKKFTEVRGIEIEVIESNKDTHTAQAAADVHGVPVSNIVKSLLLNADDEFVLILTPGHIRLDLDKWQEQLKVDDIRMANADEVKKTTGYSIGGVPPFGHTQKIPTYIEHGFDPSELLVAAAGSSNSVFKISLDELKKIVNSDE